MIISFKKIVDYLESKNINEIIIIDNQSTYLPLLDFYKKTNYKIYRMRKIGIPIIVENRVV